MPDVVEDSPTGHDASTRTDIPAGIDATGVGTWFSEQVPEAIQPLTYELIAGGHSNLTYSVTDATGAKWVLRRPPLGQVLATAHDMGREHRIISALGPTDVPVPPTIGLCTDEAVNGSPFYVMEFVDGRVVRGAPEAEALTIEERRIAGESIVDVLAAIHAVDVDAVGLGDLGKKESYIERQLKRWYGQFQGSDAQVPGGLDLPSVHEAHDTLASQVPEQGPATIVHGDYRLDNCMLGPDATISAVLDWELCTLGDPLADLGLICVYWADSDGQAVLPQAGPTAMEGFPGRDELVARYAEVSGRDISALDFYVAFGYWKLTCIIAGVYARYAGGAMGDVPAAQVAGFRAMVDTLAQLTDRAIDRIPT